MGTPGGLQEVGQQSNSPTPVVNLHHLLPSGLVGDSNEVEICIDGIKTRALLDTGSTISTINEVFLKHRFPNIEVAPLQTIMVIEYAWGQLLPYSGYVELYIDVKGITKARNKLDCFTCSRKQIQFNYTCTTRD